MEDGFKNDTRSFSPSLSLCLSLGLSYIYYPRENAAYGQLIKQIFPPVYPFPLQNTKSPTLSGIVSSSEVD